MEKVSVAARRELVAVVGARYRAALRADKRRILDEFVAVTGWHRKHAIRTLNDEGARATEPRPRPRLYDEAIRQAVLVLWEASDRVCGKRLKPLLPTLVPALERHGHLQLEATVRTRVLTISASTIDRLLSGPRATARGQAKIARRAIPAVRAGVAVRTFADWKDPPPGSMEGDLVAHCGNSVEGSFVHTLVLTDVCSGWTECVPLVVREGTLIVEALERLRTTMPFPLRSFDTDNGSEFVNEGVVDYCKRHGIEFTRSRPYRKNDQAWVEQKNGAIVRRLVGYGRLEGLVAAEALARLYAASRLFVNLFQPSFKLAEKRRNGARVSKRYHAPETPCARLLASTAVTESVKDQLRSVQISVDPLRLLDEIRAVQEQIAALAAGQRAHLPPSRNADLEGFLSGLAAAWRAGEVRATHRREPRPQRDWRTREDPFEAVWPEVRSWLDEEPDRTAKELFERLRFRYPSRFPAGQLRTLQRRVREWRSAEARRLVFGPSLPVAANGQVPAVGERFGEAGVGAALP